MNATVSSFFGDAEPFVRLGLALAVGLLIGIQRGWHTRDAAPGARLAGVRTFTLLGLLGGLWGFLSIYAGDLVLGFAFLGLVAMMIGAELVAHRKGDGEVGATTLVAALITFALGALAVRGNMAMAAAAAVIAMAVLHAKPEMHRWVAEIDRLELTGAIKLLLISVVALPLLPNRGFGPDGVLNPYAMWWMVVLISGLSFAGYFAIKLMGPRLGILMTGILGGLASSTVVTLNFARLARRRPDMAVPLAGGIGAAAAVMSVRVIVIAGVIDPRIAFELTPSLAAMTVVTAVVALAPALSAERGAEASAPEIGDPADLLNALMYGGLLVVLALISHYLKQWVGDEALYAVGAAAGLADVDAITLTMSRMAQATITREVAEIAILTAVFVNTVVKAAMAATIGGAQVGMRASAALGAGLVAALAVLGALGVAG